tara:strand:+ start:835 stop:1671 length:837 start_codon:yes stop_codon:yes gene_type:complete
MPILPPDFQNKILEIDTSINLPLVGSINPLGETGSKVPNGVDTLVAMIVNKKLAYPFRYEISFSTADALSNLRLAVSCENITMPGKNISTQEIKTHGPVDDMPYEVSYSGDVEATFKVAGDYFERNFFDAWQNTIIDPKTNNLGYKDSYSCEIEITQLDLQDQPIYHLVLEDAFPKVVGPIELGDERDGIQKQAIGFSYRKWRIRQPDEIGFLQGVINRLDLRGRLNRKLDDMFGGNIPMEPTAIGGTVLNLPWGLDPGQLTDQAGLATSDFFNNLLG